MTQQPIGSSSLITGISTLIASYIVKVFKFDMMQFGIIYTIIIAAIDWVRTIHISDSTMSGPILEYAKSLQLLVASQKTYILYGLYFIGFVGFCMGSKYLFYKFKEMWTESKRLCKIEFHTSDSVHHVVKFFGTFPETLDINHDSTIGLSELETYYQKNFKEMYEKGLSTSALTFVQELRSRFIPNVNTSIPFHMDDIKISGTLHITHKTEEYVTTKKSEKDVITEDKKSIFLMTITLNIYKNGSNYDTSKLYKYMIAKMDKKHTDDGDINLRHLSTNGHSSDCMNWIQEYFYIGKKESIETMEKVWIDPFFHPEKDRLWGLIKTIHSNPLSLIQKGQTPRANFLFHGPPGTGKSSFPFRVAMTLPSDSF